MKKSILFGSLCVLSVLTLRAQQTGIQFQEEKTWKQVLAMAAEQDRLIFLDCYTSWCGPCKAMAKDVFPLAEVGEFMNRHFINTKFDMEKGEGIELYKRYKSFIPGFPTYLLINAKGEVVHQVAGYNAADKFIAKMNNGLQQRTWIAYSQRYAAGERNWEFVHGYLQLLEEAFQSATIRQVTSEVLPSLTLPVVSGDSFAYRVFRKYWTDAESPLLATVLASPAIYRKFRDPERDINEWGGRLYKRVVNDYTKASLDSPATYNKEGARALTETLSKLHVLYRENLIALMQLSDAVVQNDADRYVQLVNAATGFGLLRYDNAYVSAAARRFAEQTNDQARLKQLLDCMQVNVNDQLLRAEEIRNYAFVLEKTGEKEKAKEYHAIADRKEAELKQQLKSLLEGKSK